MEYGRAITSTPHEHAQSETYGRHECGVERPAHNKRSPDMGSGHVEINAAYVRERLEEISKDEDLSKFIL
jgi:galactose-1-phosphate uridylyltransferase